MHILWIVCLGLVATPAPAVDADAFELLSTGYAYMVHGGRLLHDVSGGLRLVSKMFSAFDYFMDQTAQEQISEALQDSAEGSEETVTSSSPELKPQTTTQETKASPTEGSSPNNLPPEPSRSPPEPTSSSGGATNGCGLLGVEITDPSLPVKELSRCCAVHDTCYSSECKTKKRQCDRKLKSCFLDVCDDLTLEWKVQKNCQGAAKLLYAGTMALSSQQYKTAQEKLSCSKNKRRGRR